MPPKSRTATEEPDLVAEANRVFADELLPETPPADPDTGEVIEPELALSPNPVINAGPVSALLPQADPGSRAPEPGAAREEEAAAPEPEPEERSGRGREIPEQALEAAERVFGLPREEVFVTVRGGGRYLPARRRVTWMRGEPEQHPDWTIETREIKVIEGTFVNANKVEHGYARIEANVYDETGRLIASGRKTEYSERFTDFVEKAETGAIARALAIAGYGTEAALDLDEGFENDRIADAPVGHTGRPISITSSSIQGVGVGGRTSHVTDAQLAEIARLTRVLGLGASLTTVIEAVTDKPVEIHAPMTDTRAVQQAILAHLRSLSFEDGGKIVQALQKAADKEEAPPNGE